MLPELWLVVSTFCYSPLISYNSQGIEVGRLKCFECPPKCIQKVEISTYAVTAKDGETVYKAIEITNCNHKWEFWERQYKDQFGVHLKMSIDLQECKICGKKRRKLEKWEDVE